MASELRPRFTELLKNERAIAGELLKLGLPPALQEIAWTSSTFVLFWILALSKQPSEAVAAWTIGQRLEAFALLPLTTMAVAILVIVGQNVGAGRVQRAWNASWGVVGVGMALMVAVGVAFFFLYDAIAAMANPTAEAKPYVVTYLRMVALGLPFAALETLLGGSLQALDDTRIPMIIGFVSNWVVSLPPMYWLSVVLGYGPSGAWVAILLSTITSGSLIAWRFRSRPIWRAFGVLPAGESDPRTQ
jgi:Na+-driven multidrug efflux pump